ncbi:hypothetical protein BVRB_022600, partial [Beta vulgaris subsp. vulgaris]
MASPTAANTNASNNGSTVSVNSKASNQYIRKTPSAFLPPRIWAEYSPRPQHEADDDLSSSSDSESWRRQPRRTRSAFSSAAVFPFPIDHAQADAKDKQPQRSYSSKKWTDASSAVGTPRDSWPASRSNSVRLDLSAIESSAVRSFNTKINLLAQQGKHREVLEMIDEARASGDKSLQEALNTQTFTILVKAYCNNGNLEAAEYMVEEMRSFDEHQRPNRFTLNTLLNGYVKRDQMKKAAELFRSMVSSSDVKQRPDHVTYSTIIKGFAWRRRH